MTQRILGPTGSPRRRWTLILPLVAAFAFGLFYIAGAQAVLPGSPSNFESDDGNMVVDTTGNNDWASVDFNLIVDGTGATDSSYTPGQDFDVNCPTIVGHSNPPKDDFTHVASFSEKNSTSGDTYLYGATIRVAANGNASENLELKQGPDLCPGSTLLARKAGDKLLAIDYLGGGANVDFHVLTGVTSGPCFIANHSSANGCWGATVLELDPTEAEGATNLSAITAANNPISNANLVVNQFAEFGVNLAEAGILPPGSCASINQIIWLSRSSGSSFGSQPKDAAVEDVSINVCASVSVHKTGSDGGSQEGAVFTLYEGSDTTGTVVGTCTVDANGDCDSLDFQDLNPGTYTIDETTVPAGYDPDPSLPFTFTLAEGENKELEFTDPAQEGALIILKNSTKGGAVSTAGAEFSYDSTSVIDNGTGDEDPAVGSVCVSGLDPGDYTVTETSPPGGYAADSGGGQTVTVVNGTDCATAGAGATATFTNAPLSDIQVNFRDGGSGETSATISCDNTTGTQDTTPADGWDTSDTESDIEAPAIVTCTITIDP
jgi:Prealbumin-like fold domain